MERPIRDLHSCKQTQSMFCKVIINPDGKIYLQKKSDKKKFELILWDDVVYQVEAAKEATNNQINIA